MRSDPAEPNENDVVDQASAWCLRLSGRNLTPQEQDELDAWLRADGAHREALDDASGVWRSVGQAAASPELIGMRTAALESFRRANRVRWAPRLFSMRASVATFAAAVAVIVIGAGIWVHFTPRTYLTGVGERRVVALSDGSKISLDAATRVDVRYLGDRRELRLDYGRAKFTVAKNPKRPFTVTAADRVVLATGTEFSVEMLDSQVRVILYQGHVAVLDRPSGGEPPRHVPLAARPGPADQSLLPGRELIASIAAPMAEVVSADPERSLSWEGGQLAFADEPLSSAVERVNRYSTSKLAIGDAAAGRILISGTFSAGDTAAFVEGVTSVFPVGVRQVDGREVLISKGN